MCSSPRSPQPSSPDGLAALGAAAVRVAEDSLFAYAEPCEAARSGELLGERPAGEPWLVASIAFTGPFEGVVRVSLPGSLAAELGATFCGLPADELDDAKVADFAGELANMVCGSWLTQTHRADRFTLAAPLVATTVGEDVATTFRSEAALGIALNDAPVLIALLAAAVAGS